MIVADRQILTIFAHLALLLTPTFPNPLLSTLLRSTFPALVSHHDRLLAVLFPGDSSWSTVPRLPQPNKVESSWSEWVSSFWSAEPRKTQISKREREFGRARLLWFSGASLAMFTYLLVSGMLTSVRVRMYEGGVTTEEGDEEEDEGV